MGVAGDRVVAQDAAGRPVARAVTAADGRFRLVLAPGGYRIVEQGCGATGRIEVHAGTTVALSLRLLPGAC